MQITPILICRGVIVLKPEFRRKMALLWFAFAGILTGLNGCSQSKPDPGSADLTRLCEELHSCITSGDEAKAAQITKALLPDRARLERVLSDNADAGVKQKIFDFHGELATGNQNLSRLIEAKPNQKVVKVHAATSEEIAQYSPGSVAYAEFPGGAQKLAQQGILRPKLTFYEVEFLEPGQDAGMKYHLFYWDGSSWKMLGPVWRVLK